MRLDRYLSEMGVETRSRIREMCRRGLVRVNGAVQKKGDTQVVPGKDVITAAGEEIVYREKVYLMMNKPAGVVTAVSDPREKTVMDLISGYRRKDLFPAGRLDKDTEGLLLITNDGELAKRLLSPKHHVEKMYFARVRGRIGEEEIRRFREGLDIGDDRKTLPAKLAVQTDAEESEVLVTLTEGRFHQVKRMFHAIGSEVLYLRRVSMGSLVLDESLLPGAWRDLTPEETAALTGRDDGRGRTGEEGEDHESSGR